MNRLKTVGAILCIAFALFTPGASALPTYARQLGVQCAACHNTNFLALNAFGRQFKLQGYTQSSGKNIDQSDTGRNAQPLSLPEFPGVSAMLQTSISHISGDTPGQQNDEIRLPQQLSLFLAGRVTDRVGVFSQFTYAEGDSGFAVDNTDLRYADATIVNGKSLQYGITLDNNPTVGDLWNSTPAWGYPYSSSDVAPEPGADGLIGSLGGAVAGLGAYGMLDGKYYGHFALYRNTSVNSTAGSTNVIDGVAPYWRLAWQKNIGTSYLMLGTYGLDAKVIPDAMTVAGGIGGPTARYLDTALDFQYERPVTGNTSLVAHGSFTRERRSDVDADGAYLAGSRETWKFSKVDVEYNMGRWRPGLAAFNTDTASDGLDSRGYLLSVGYFPWQNLELDLQYRGYTKFDGTSANAGDNDSVYLGLWLMI